jgi:hypothetical protein
MKVVNVSEGDYRVIVRDGGTITLDVGDQSFNGKVVITGDLWVQGNTTTISSEELTVKDNIVYINVNGGSAIGIPSAAPLNGLAGIEIDRGGSGDYANTRLLFDESVSHLSSIGDQKNGTFSFKRLDGGTGSLVGIQTCSINTAGKNLYLINAGRPPGIEHPNGPVVTVTGTDEYEKDVFNYADFIQVPPVGPLIIVKPDALPNVQALADYVDSKLSFFDDYAISESNTSVECIDKDVANFYRLLLNPTYTLPVDSRIVFKVDGNQRAEFNVLGLDVDNVNIFTNTINNSTNNLILTSTAAAKIVEVDAVLQLNDTGLGPTALTGATKIYTQDSDTTPAPGKTGIYFTSLGNSDELVAKNRALLFSILF